jgi:tol-pal system protein YbgF
MTHRRTFAALALVCGLASADVGAQSRDQLQMMADMRMLQEQVQQLRQLVATLSEQNKTVLTRLDTQAEADRKASADQQTLIRDLQRNVQTLEESINQNTTQMGRVNTEIAALREGMTMLQREQAQILTQLTAVNPIGAADPSGGAGAGATGAGGTGAGGATGGSIPASPSTYYSTAFSDYSVGSYQLAIDGFLDYLSRFPTGPDAASAQYFIGESYFNLKKYDEALKAYADVVVKYKDSDKVAGAYLRQGLMYERLQKRTDAINIYKLVVNKFPASSAEVAQANQALARIGGK